MAKVRNYGTGTGWSKGTVTGRKMEFGANEKVYAEWVLDEAEKDGKSTIIFYRKEAGKWVEKVRNSAVNSAGYSTFYHWAWIKDYPQGEWQVEFLWNGSVLATHWFNLGTVVPPVPVPEKEMAVYYEADDDKNAAMILSEFFDVHLIQSNKTGLNIADYRKIVSVGAQIANKLSKKIMDETGLRYVTEGDAGYTFIQVGRWPPHDVFIVGGWSAADTMNAVKYIRARGLPTETVRIKTPVAVPVETPEQKAWREYFENPDIIKQIGLLPGSTIESFCRVFGGWSYINQEPAEANPLDWAAVFGVVGGLALASLGAVLAALPVATSLLGKAGMIKAQTTLTGEVIRVGVPTVAAKAASTSPWIKALVVWNLLTDWVWIQSMLHDLGAEVTGDVSRRGTNLRYTLNEQLKELNNKISFAETEADWKDIKTRVDTIEPLIEEYKALLAGAGVEVHMPEVWLEVENMASNFAEFKRRAYEEAGIIPKYPTFPEEIIIKNVQVEDGDTIIYPGHPEVQSAIRFVGIDTHELGTEAGKKEAEYLKNMIEGKTITIKVDPHPGKEEDDGRQIDYYGRLLGVPFINGTNIVEVMLRRFGTDILTKTTYQKKHKYVDWNLLKEAAETGFIEKAKVKVYSKPAYAELWIDGNDTGKIAIETFELAIGQTYTITAKKTGYHSQDKSITVPADGIEVRFELSETVLGEEIPGVPGIPEEEFKIYIDSTPSNAKLFIDGTYTRHLTPSHEKELKDVMDLLAPGEHVIKATKGGKEASAKVTITSGRNPDIMLTLGVAGLVPAEPEVITPVITEEEAPAEVPAAEEFKISIMSTPSRAQLYIDGVYTHHLTPSNAKELSDVMHLLTPGDHVLRVEKAGKAAEKKINIKPGYNEPIYFTLEVVGLPRSKEEIEKEITDVKALLEKLQAELAKL